MHYEDAGLGYSFNLPDGWRKDEHIRSPLTFFGPNGRIGYGNELIQIGIGRINQYYLDPVHREEYLAEPGAVIRRGKLGDETNVVIMERADNSEISAVRDNIQYSISHGHDAATREVVSQLVESFQFPSPDKASAFIQRRSDPANQVIEQVLRADSAEEARHILGAAGMPPAIERPGYTMHRIGDDEEGEAQEIHKSVKRWWQFWK